MKDQRMAASQGDRSAESRRVLDRLAQEAGTSGLGVVGRTAGRARDHLSASDADHHDWAELWGTRIGRTIGLVVTAVTLVWALSLLYPGA